MGGDKLARGARSATFNGPAEEMPGTDVGYPLDQQEYETVTTWANSEAREVLDITFDSKPQVGYEGEPVGDSILVQRVEREHSSNLVLPDSMKAKSEIGFIVAKGEKVKRFKVGQMILFDKFASHGADIELVDADGVERKMLLLKDYDVLIALKKVTLSPSQA